ncbi:MAG: YfiT family bacillithiol transferase [Gemmatimonadota bacterium]
MDLSYPIGPFVAPASLDAAARRSAIAAIRTAAGEFRAGVEGLTEAQLDTPYRPGGWTVRQLAHHLPDSHLNAYVRFKLGLTEPHPTIKPYDQAAWAGLPDSTGPVGPSLDLLTALHQRWTLVLEGMSEKDFARTLNHPEAGTLRLDQLLAMYAWHGRHHTAHVTTLKERQKW